MSKEKSLRKKIREIVRTTFNEESFVGSWFRKLAKNVEDREFARLLAQQPELQRRLDKIKKSTEKDVKSLEKYMKAIKKKKVSNNFRD